MKNRLPGLVLLAGLVVSSQSAVASITYVTWTFNTTDPSINLSTVMVVWYGTEHGTSATQQGPWWGGNGMVLSGTNLSYQASVAYSGGGPEAGVNWNWTAWTTGTGGGSISNPNLICSPSEQQMPGADGANHYIQVMLTKMPVVQAYNGTVTLHNTTGNPEYFQFAPQGLPNNPVYGGCSGNVSVGGAVGDDNTGDNWFAVYPGETQTVNISAMGPGGLAPVVQALQANPGLVPCQTDLSNPRCVNLCSDGQMVTSSTEGNSFISSTSPMSTTSTPNPTNTLPPNTAQPGSGTNGQMLFPVDTNNNLTPPSGAAANSTMIAGFNGLNADLMNGQQNALANYSLMVGLGSNELAVLQQIRTNTSSMSVGSNVFYFTNYTTNNIAVTVTNSSGSGSGSGGGNGVPTNWGVAAQYAQSNLLQQATNMGADANSLSNIGSAMGQGFSMNMSNLVGHPVYGGAGTPSSDGLAITLPATGTGVVNVMTVSWDSFAAKVAASSWVFTARWCIAVFVLAWAFQYVSKISQKAMWGVLQQRQLGGSLQEGAGFNTSLLTGLAYFGIFAAMVVSLPAASWIFISTMAAHTGAYGGAGAPGGLSSGMTSIFGSVSSSFSSLASNPAYKMVTALIPVDAFIYTWVDVYVYEYLFMLSLCSLCRGVVLAFLR